MNSGHFFSGFCSNWILIVLSFFYKLPGIFPSPLLLKIYSIQKYSTINASSSLRDRMKSNLLYLVIFQNYFRLFKSSFFANKTMALKLTV